MSLAAHKTASLQHKQGVSRRTRQTRQSADMGAPVTDGALEPQAADVAKVAPPGGFAHS